MEGEYNKLLVREKNAEKFFEGKTYAECEKWLKDFDNITITLSKMMHQLENKLGRKLTDEEALNGF